MVSSGSRLPFGPPRCWSNRPAGPNSSNRFFQLNSVHFETPTSAAKSPAGRPLRCQVSNKSTRCSGVVEIERDSARFRRGPPRRLATRFGGNGGAASSDTAPLGASPNASASSRSFSTDSSLADAPAAKPPRRPGPRSPSAGRAAGEDSLRPGLSESSPAFRVSSPCPRCFTGSNMASSLFWRRPFLYLFNLSNRQTFREGGQRPLRARRIQP